MTDVTVTKRNGSKEPLNIDKIHGHVAWGCDGITGVAQSEVEANAKIMFFEGIKSSDIQKALIKSAASLISEEAPNYTFVAAKLLLMTLYKEVEGNGFTYPNLSNYIRNGVAQERLHANLFGMFDLDLLDAAIRPERDYQFTYLGLQTVADRYLIREQVKSGEDKGKIIEMPQHFFMRVAMGLSLHEGTKRNERAIEFYEILSSFDFMDSTPTLFNSGTLHSQMSSCYLNTMADEIGDVGGKVGIFNTFVENANLSKFAGGIGTDFTPVRPTGSPIKSTNGISSGVIPYMKIMNDTAVAVNQGGKRNGAIAMYLEPTHGDFMEFCDLKKQAGDERRRTHDAFPAAWTPDLFMKRVIEANAVDADGGDTSSVVWSFFAHPYQAELHGLYGDAFEARYLELEEQGLAAKQMPVLEVWRKWITSLAQTGAPWITFKDECNRRNPQSHVGMINNSNLCTEITLNTSDTETAVCNLGSINLSRHIAEDGSGFDKEKLRATIQTAMRMLDNVIDLNFYPSEKARASNMRHRPVGMGVMGLTEMLVANGIDWESEENVAFQDELFEWISYYAIEASSDLAKERGSYPSYYGSKWQKGILPIDTAKTQGMTAPDAWDALREKVKSQGMRNSNTMAIAPTATISNICGTTPCIEPVYERSYMKENKSGTFQIVDPCFKYGRPDLIKESFEIDQEWVLRTAGVRQKWIDQAQSVNIFRRLGMKGSELADLYIRAWQLGLKTTYYLRNQQKASTGGELIKDQVVEEAPEAAMCSITDPNCESCQ